MKAKTAVRSLETKREALAAVGTAIQDIYSGAVDVVVVRGAFSPDALTSLAGSLDRSESSHAWARPNAIVPTEDIYILGTDIPATPTCRTPRGASLDAYLESAKQHAGTAERILGESLDAEQEISALLSSLSGGKPVEVARTADGRRYVPYTLRMLKEGRQISVHHDYHYRLPLYQDLAQSLDTTTLISFFLTLQDPEQGGGLIVYGLSSDDPDQPTLPNGRSDLEAIEKGFTRARFELFPGDFVLLASGRRFHRVEPVGGPRSRVTLGGFLAFDRDRKKIFFWS